MYFCNGMLFHISISMKGVNVYVCGNIYISIHFVETIKKEGGNNQYCVVLKSAESRACVNMVK